MSDFKTRDFWYDLPEELIAQTPLQKRDTSRLLAVDRRTGELAHRHFYDILDYLNPGDTLVMNDSRVLPARLLGHRPTGGAAELLLLRDLGDNRWECLAKPGRKLTQGAEVILGDGRLTAKVVEVKEDGNRVVHFDYQGIFLEVLESLGKMPLPPTSKRNSRTRSGIRPSIPGRSAPPQPPPPVCTGPKNCCKRPRTRASGLPM